MVDLRLISITSCFKLQATPIVIYSGDRLTELDFPFYVVAFTVNLAPSFSNSRKNPETQYFFARPGEGSGKYVVKTRRNG